MMKLWNLLVSTNYCLHKWNILEYGEILRQDHKDGDPPVGTFFHLQCEKCGDVKVRNLK